MRPSCPASFERRIIMRANAVDPRSVPGLKRFFRGLALVVVGTVLVCAVAVLVGPTLRAADTGAVASVSSTPFTFDAPTATLHRVKGVEKPAGATAQADVVTLGDFKFTQQSFTPAEITFLFLLDINNPQIVPEVVLTLLFPGVLDFLANYTPFQQFLLLDIYAFFLLGHNPLAPPPAPVSPTK
jgi:hypothetical protein